MITEIKSDLNRYLFLYKKRGYSSFVKIYWIIFSFGFYASAVFRFGTLINSIKGRIYLLPLYYLGNVIYIFFNFLMIKMFGINIDRNASIDRGLFINHFGGIYIGKCRMGSNCSIHHQVKIGYSEDPGNEDYSIPLIGNNVWIGGHAIIYNNVVIEDNATIAAGSVVKSNVNKNNLVMGNPARVINKNFDYTTLLVNMDEI